MLDPFPGAYMQLLEEENLPARAAIITGLGAVGVILGSRRGRVRGIRRLVGAGVGAGLLHSTHGSGVSVLMCLTSTGLYLFLDYKET